MTGRACLVKLNNKDNKFGIKDEVFIFLLLFHIIYNYLFHSQSFDRLRIKKKKVLHRGEELSGTIRIVGVEVFKVDNRLPFRPCKTFGRSRGSIDLKVYLVALTF